MKTKSSVPVDSTRGKLWFTVMHATVNFADGQLPSKDAFSPTQSESGHESGNHTSIVIGIVIVKAQQKAMSPGSLHG